MVEKICRVCGFAGDSCLFPKKENRCKSCLKEYKRIYRKNNIEKINAYRETNKKRIKIQRKEYRHKNAEIIAAYDTLYRVKNKEHILKQKKFYAKNNREKINRYEKVYVNRRRLMDPVYKLRCLLRTRLGHAIRNKAKTGSAVTDLKIDVNVLLVYLNLDCLYKYGIPYTKNEHLFHIDHIKPLCSFDLTNRDEYIKAVHWSNLQVLTIEDNLRKGGVKN